MSLLDFRAGGYIEHRFASPGVSLDSVRQMRGGGPISAPSLIGTRGGPLESTWARLTVRAARRISHQRHLRHSRPRCGCRPGGIDHTHTARHGPPPGGSSQWSRSAYPMVKSFDSVGGDQVPGVAAAAPEMFVLSRMTSGHRTSLRDGMSVMTRMRTCPDAVQEMSRIAVFIRLSNGLREFGPYAA